MTITVQDHSIPVVAYFDEIDGELHSTYWSCKHWFVAYECLVCGLNVEEV